MSKYTTRAIFVALLIALLALAGWAAHLGWHTFQLIRLAPQASALVREEMGEIDPTQALRLLHKTAVHLGAVDRDLRLVYPFLKAASLLPVIGPYASQVQPLLSLGANLTLAADRAATGFAPLLADATQTGADTPLLSQAIQVIQAGQSDFAAAGEYLQRASQARLGIEPALLPGYLRPWIARLDEYLPRLQQGIDFLPGIPGLLGAEQPITYLILAQNRDELRPTGGFISGIGTLVLDQGRIVKFELGDSYRIDDFSKPYPAPPEALQRLMLADYWVTRDANWSPDFPSSARQAQQLYTLSTGEETHGVIAFDQEAVRAIVTLTGPLSLPDAPQAISADNIETYMRQAWAPDLSQGLTGEWWLRRKDFMGLLGSAILEQLLQAREARTMLEIAAQSQELMESGHLLVYFSEPSAQQLIASAGLDHSLKTAQGDFLMVVDTNFGFNKADAAILRGVEYQLDFSDPARPTARLSLNYGHSGQEQVACEHLPTYGKGTYEDLIARCYWDYWRVYLPNGTRLLDSQVKPVPAEWLLSKATWPGVVEAYPGENGSQVFAGLLVLPPAASETIQLHLQLPTEMVEREQDGTLHYRLRIHKQPGLSSAPYQIKVRLPAGYSLAPAITGWQQESVSTWVWNGRLVKDQDFHLLFVHE